MQQTTAWSELLPDEHPHFLYLLFGLVLSSISAIVL